MLQNIETILKINNKKILKIINTQYYIKYNIILEYNKIKINIIKLFKNIYI